MVFNKDEIEQRLHKRWRITFVENITGKEGVKSIVTDHAKIQLDAVEICRHIREINSYIKSQCDVNTQKFYDSVSEYNDCIHYNNQYLSDFRRVKSIKELLSNIKETKYEMMPSEEMVIAKYNTIQDTINKKMYEEIRKRPNTKIIKFENYG